MKNEGAKRGGKSAIQLMMHTKKAVMTLIIGTLGFGMFSQMAGVKAFGATSDFVVSDNWLEPAQIHVSEDNSLKKRGAVLPEAYDGRANGMVTAVKDQGENDTCWAFATIAAMEGNLIKTGRADATLDLSENQFAYFFYNRQVDKLGYTQGDYNTTTRNYLSAGGTLQGSGLALATWAGVTTEARSPYLTQPSVDLCYAADYSVKNIYLYDYDVKKLATSVSTLKQAVLDHGAVASGIYMDKAYYNEEHASYYYPVSDGKGNHAVTIIGWDDNYPKENFNRKPSQNGAWIIKNSYGDSFGENGYNYVSYEDTSLMEMMAVEAVTQAEQYDNNYQHDGTANPAYSFNGGEYYANVFTAKGASGCNEELKAVGFYTLSTNTRYEIQVYSGLTSEAKPTSGTKAFSSAVTGALSDAGFQTVTLPYPVTLTAGEKFSIVIKVTEPSGRLAYMGVDSSYRNDWIGFIANTEKNQSFVCVGGNWYDFGVERRANARIKAYTDNTGDKTGFSLSSKNLGVSKGASEKLSLKTSAAHVFRTVTWKSSNSKIATVNKSGKITGKAYGSATITASFMAGAGKKTLKCKVTVGPSKLNGFQVSGGKKLKVKWKKKSGAKGYEIYYASGQDGKYKKLAAISKGSKTSYSKKMKTGTYYIKMRPYQLEGKKKLYGSFSGAKKVVIR